MNTPPARAIIRRGRHVTYRMAVYLSDDLLIRAQIVDVDGHPGNVRRALIRYVDPRTRVTSTRWTRPNRLEP